MDGKRSPSPRQRRSWLPRSRAAAERRITDPNTRRRTGRAFVARCVDSGDTPVYCGCAIDVLSERLSLGEYNDLLEADAAGTGFAGLPADSEGEVREALDEVSASCG